MAPLSEFRMSVIQAVQGRQGGETTTACQSCFSEWQWQLAQLHPVQSHLGSNYTTMGVSGLALSRMGTPMDQGSA
eukprot:CAMPEP_0194763054 /NCGR_PEP_ID=MMETSP0323_2-20130528/17829_1 /TAXON_ID=2866 ORGANISM="Crypthecodinium cohnii, Strain Seligo" /NCGR_SAMPLE_ID=MMETSP0323_2 /ASSEMBLY_ACC=CAM_ASM_000346 /LENGTH=74 /DNA_ID=CAMNT_0039686959 /DNA_START=23 /DNA_END=247 /DNA_ORIENTATION=-